MDGNRSKQSMYAKRCTVVVLSALLLLSACMNYNPALIEGQWTLDEITPLDTNASTGIATSLASAFARGITIEFRQGQAFIPISNSYTVRLDYRLQRDSLYLRSGEAMVARFRIATLTDRLLRLETDSVVLAFIRN